MELQESRQEFNDLKGFATDNMPEIHELTQIGSLPLIVDVEPIQNALITIADLGIAAIPLAASLGSKFLTLIEKRNTLSHAKFEKNQAKEQVKDIQSILKIQKQAKNKFEITSIESKSNHELKVKELQDQYISMNNEARQDSVNNISAKFEEFFEENGKLRNLTMARLYELSSELTKENENIFIAGMSHRQSVSDLIEDYCDAVFYHSFTPCERSSSLSDDFYSVLDALHRIQWGLVTSDSSLPRK